MTTKLYYFGGGVRARAESLRMMLEYREVPYEFVAVQHGGQSSFPYGQLPVLEVNGKRIAQSGSIARYIAWTHDLVPHTTDQEIIGLCDSKFEMTQEMSRLNVMANFLKDKSLEEAYTEWNGKIDKYLGYLSRDLQGPYYMGDKITYTDFAAFHVLDQIKNLFPGHFEGQQKLVDFHTKFSQLKGVSSYLEKRGPLSEERLAAIRSAYQQICNV